MQKTKEIIDVSRLRTTDTHWKMAVEFSELSNPMIHREQKCIVLFILSDFVNGTYHLS